MAKQNKEILVVDRATLFSDSYFQGFAPADGVNYRRIIHDNYFYMKRKLAEPNPIYKQPIAYAIIVNKENRHIFAYQRAGTADYHEDRLRGKWSWGIGGHIDRVDSEEQDPIMTSLLREIEEEVEIDDYDEPTILGYINDDQTEVGTVHFGLLYLVKTSSKRVKARDKEISWGGFMSYDQLEEICMLDDKNVESWSEISLEPIRRALGLGEEAED
ncbi:NUDIX domain-containing protein [candidate division KSB1 bacterium]|nr:NUDIX domain-containing protein [candidate division KSB1 bacterium]RQW02828.1 MAG: NUDIX domain-containing protein [candidate division KSB1 bacterium]